MFANPLQTMTTTLLRWTWSWLLLRIVRQDSSNEVIECFRGRHQSVSLRAE